MASAPPTSDADVTTVLPATGQQDAVVRPRSSLTWGVVHGLSAVVGPLVLAGVLGLGSWYLSDAGAHGTAGDAVRRGAIGWLVGHGSGFSVDGVAVTVVPLALTLLIAWWVWRSALRLGERVWAHGPDAHRIGDGERDWTVPVALLGFAAAYLVTTAIVLNLVSGPTFDPRIGRVLVVALALVLGLGGPGIATGSGRAAAWVSQLPPVVRHAVSTARRVLVWWLLTCLVLVVGAVGVGLGDALDTVEALDLAPGETLQLLLLNLAFVPNATLLAGAFLLGPGFALGSATAVAPAHVALGPLPLMPLLAALPDPGTPPSWWSAAPGVAVVVAALAAWRHQRERPTLRWDEGALRSCGAGLLAAIGFALACATAGGALGPGRLRDSGAALGEVALHGVVWLGLGALLGGVAITWWQRHTSVPVDPTPDGAAP